jgi:two-component system, chemotaxis family, chemotaxis protein CheY
MHALIVDDSRAMRMILEKSLREVGFEVDGVGHGQSAIDFLDQGEPVDLMLVDWNMPVMNGYDLVRAVRANPLLSDLRIMMVTTETSMTNVEMALSAGANEYLMKPFTAEVLQEKLALLGMS